MTTDHVPPGLMGTIRAADIIAIVTDCAGCGAALKEYEELLEESGEHDKLALFHSRIKDISEFLAEQGLRTDNLKPPRLLLAAVSRIALHPDHIRRLCRLPLHRPIVPDPGAADDAERRLSGGIRLGGGK